ncbi:MAG: hypothetical protein IT423_07275, partial [Pirellulaceae bacterium]|nr:hypothetical protein [Pirellulaceae bacterium]
DFVRVEDDVLNILMDTQIPRQKSHARPPIALLLACYTGAFDAREDCLSEQMVMSPGGPVASIAATRVTGPYGLATMTSRMLDECYVERTQSLGQVFLSAKQQMLLPDLPIDSSESPRDAQMQLITAVASALSPPGYDLLAERREHVWQVNLLGDPLLRLNHPDAIELKAPSRVLPGEPMAISGLSLQSGKVTVELTLPRDRSPKNLYVAGKFSADAQVREKMHSSYALANQRTLVSKTLELALPGPFECELQVPMDVMPGRYIVRVFIEGKLTCSAGSTEVQVARKRR